MKYLLLALILLSPFAVSAARFDFTNGQPAVTDDGAVGDTLEQTRYDFTNGQPSPVFDATAVEEEPAPASSNDTLVINNGTMVISNGTLIIQ